MRNILFLLIFFIFSCAKPLVVETVQPGDNLLNCTELKQEIEEAKKIKQEAEFSKASGGNFARAILFWPAWAQSLNNADDAILAANNRSFHLIKVMRKKNCPGADSLEANIVDEPKKVVETNLADQLKTLKELNQEPQDFINAIKIFKKYNIFEDCKKKTREFVSVSIKSLEKLPDTEIKKHLICLASESTERSK